VAIGDTLQRVRSPHERLPTRWRPRAAGRSQARHRA